MSRRHYISLTTALVLILISAGISYYLRRIEGMAEVRAATERIAELIARGDRDALLKDPFLSETYGIGDHLLKSGRGLSGGYTISIVRNGDNGYTRASLDDISHLAYIHARKGYLLIDVWYDRSSKEAKVVGCGTTVTSSGEDPPVSEIPSGPVNSKKPTD